MAQAGRRAQPAAVNFHRQNQQQLREQAELIRERRKQEAAEEDRKQQRRDKLAAQYHSGPRVAVGGKPQQPAAAPAPQPLGERIEVFVRETDPGAADRHYVYYDMEPTAAPGGGGQPSDREPARGYSQARPKEPVRGPPGGPRGAARRPSREHASGGAAPADAPAAPSPGGVSRAESGVSHPAGHVPRYLTKRKQELLEEKELLQQAAAEQARVAQYPPGMVPLDEEKRLEMLKGLEDRKLGLMAEFNRLPMRFDTQAVRKRREGLEDGIRDCESQIAKFSRKLVYVPADA